MELYTKTMNTTQTTTATPSTLTIRGRAYSVQAVDLGAMKEPGYILTGVRGARYMTIRNVNHPGMMFLMNERTISKHCALDGVWLSDAKGSLAVVCD